MRDTAGSSCGTPAKSPNPSCGVSGPLHDSWRRGGPGQGHTLSLSCMCHTSGGVTWHSSHDKPRPRRVCLKPLRLFVGILFFFLFPTILFINNKVLCTELPWKFLFSLIHIIRTIFTATSNSLVFCLLDSCGKISFPMTH